MWFIFSFPSKTTMSFSMRSRSFAARVPNQPDLSVLGSEVQNGGSLYPDLNASYGNSYGNSYGAPYTFQSAIPSAPVMNDVRAQQILVCYLPEHSNEGVYSCTREKDGDKIIFTTDHRAAIVPAGAIIDSIEFFGYNGFTTKDVFSIGLGQLNSDITFPLIQDTDSMIAQERVGGCRDYFSFDRDGRNTRNIVICDSYVNIVLSSPVIQGGLQVVVRYHMKLI